ncbi:phosphate ABC transporter permease PstA [Natrinema salifodinae]|uniref:Phosphate transport system permease protein PstA n=1 Tax=Natrinema salifodinae TaxID=1202768 RepID=A0A1I0M018_9EURY|nr:phosphate ABC transporter permease PstA [Natrinema salifodinae]SEV80787.1 phosphate ABC transporter membrane protein 2, PhoT family [Natrinema salifodinae]
MATIDDQTEAWYGAEGQISQLRGLLFKLGCLGATLLALLLVFVFLLYVANDAIEPMSVEPIWTVTLTAPIWAVSVTVPLPAWWLAVAATVGAPALALTGYYYRFDPRAGEVAYAALGLPIAATLLAGGVVIAFRHIVSPREWLALVVAAAVAVGLLALHVRTRDAAAVERGLVATLVPLLVVVGVPGVVPSLRGLILSLPVLPLPSLSLLGTFAAPVGLGVAWYVSRVRESPRAGWLAGGATVVASALGLVAAPLVGIAATTWIVLVTVVGVPVGLYVERVVRRGEGIAGLAMPVVIGAGVVACALVVEALGFSGPNVWFDWDFLTTAHSRDPYDAGIYPALVGSVMLIIVVAVSAFPVGVGAAIYLEEYAPSEGPLGRFVELIEINIANLAGVPSVVYGLLGVALFVNTAGLGRGIVVVGGLTVGLLVLPIVIVSAQEAIQAVPDSQRRAAYGMGATRWQMVRTTVLPRAMPGILTGTILALGRAIGETAPLLMVGVAAVVRIPPNSFFSRFSAMPRQIFSWARLAQPEFYHGVLAAGVLVLLTVLLMMNGTAILLRNKYQRRE